MATQATDFSDTSARCIPIGGDFPIANTLEVFGAEKLIEEGRILYSGDASGPALRFNAGMWGHTMRRATVLRTGVYTGTVGIALSDKPPPSVGQGTVTGTAVYDQVAVTGFETGIHIGSDINATAASEIEFRSLKVQNGRCGVFLDGQGVTVDNPHPEIAIVGTDWRGN